MRRQAWSHGHPSPLGYRTVGGALVAMGSYANLSPLEHGYTESLDLTGLAQRLHALLQTHNEWMNECTRWTHAVIKAKAISTKYVCVTWLCMYFCCCCEDVHYLAIHARADVHPYGKVGGQSSLWKVPLGLSTLVPPERGRKERWLLSDITMSRLCLMPCNSTYGHSL